MGLFFGDFALKGKLTLSYLSSVTLKDVIAEVRGAGQYDASWYRKGVLRYILQHYHAKSVDEYSIDFDKSFFFSKLTRYELCYICCEIAKTDINSAIKVFSHPNIASDIKKLFKHNYRANLHEHFYNVFLLIDFETFNHDDIIRLYKAAENSPNIRSTINAVVNISRALNEGSFNHAKEVALESIEKIKPYAITYYLLKALSILIPSEKIETKLAIYKIFNSVEKNIFSKFDEFTGKEIIIKKANRISLPIIEITPPNNDEPLQIVRTITPDDSPSLPLLSEDEKSSFKP